MNHRRKLLAVLGVGAPVNPFCALAQPPPAELRRIGYLTLGSAESNAHYLIAFRAGMAANVESSEAGALMSYGASVSGNFRRAAGYVDKIFKGAKPGELPIQQPVTFEFVVNLKTAKAIGVTLPPIVLLQANRVIE